MIASCITPLCGFQVAEHHCGCLVFALGIEVKLLYEVLVSEDRDGCFCMVVVYIETTLLTVKH